MARTASRPRPSPGKRAQPSIRRLLIADALRSWVAPTVAIVVVAVAMLLDTLELVSDAPAAAIAVVGVLVLAAYLAVSPLVAEEHAERFPPLVVVGVAAVVGAVVAVPFFTRLFPGTPLRTPVALDAAAKGAVLVAPGVASRVNVVIEAQLPLAADRRDRSVHYDLDLVDDAGTHQHVDGELGDSWRERRLGRRGTAPSHFEHLSTTHVVDVGGGGLRLADVTLVGEAHASASATVYRHRMPPTAVLYIVAILFVGAALVFDLWWDGAEGSSVTMVTASACAAALVFLEGGAGHPGMRDVIGAAIVGAIAGTIIGGSATWIGRLVSPFGRTRRRA